MGVPVLVVDDHRLFAQLLQDAFTHAGHGVVLGDPGELDDASLLALAGGDPPPVVVLDLQLGAGRSGMELVSAFTRRRCAVVVLTASVDRSVHAQAVRAGAVAVLEKLVSLDELLAVVDAVVRGDHAMDAQQRALLEAAADELDELGDVDGLRLLTSRERQVLDGLVTGRSAKDIANDLGLALPTVRTQIRAIYRKLDVHNQRAAILVALRGGWLSSR